MSHVTFPGRDRDADLRRVAFYFVDRMVAHQKAFDGPALYALHPFAYNPTEVVRRLLGLPHPDDATADALDSPPHVDPRPRYADLLYLYTNDLLCSIWGYLATLLPPLVPPLPSDPFPPLPPPPTLVSVGWEDSDRHRLRVNVAEQRVDLLDHPGVEEAVVTRWMADEPALYINHPATREARIRERYGCACLLFLDRFIGAPDFWVRSADEPCTPKAGLYTIEILP